MFHYMRNIESDIIFLQETHSDTSIGGGSGGGGTGGGGRVPPKFQVGGIIHP